VAAVQYTFTHKHYTEYRERNIQCRPCPVFARCTLAFCLQMRKKHGKISVRVVEKCHDILMAAIQYSFTHKQYKEQHNEREYTQRNTDRIHRTEHKIEYTEWNTRQNTKNGT
jgi:hypothetical protein